MFPLLRQQRSCDARLGRKFHQDSGAFARFTADFQHSADELSHSARHSKPQTQSREGTVGRCVDLMKWLKDRVYLILCYTNTCVCNVELDTGMVGCWMCLDPNFPLGCELDRIVKNILKDPLDFGAVADYGHSGIGHL